MLSRLLALALLVIPVAGFAGPGPPWASATRSANGKFLVVVEYQYDNPNSRVVRHVVNTTYRVLELETFTNPRDRLSTALQFYWQGSSWEVKLPYGLDSLPLISNDGKTLVLVTIMGASLDAEVLRIYQRDQYEGKLIRRIKLREIPTAAQVASDRTQFGFDPSEEPQWYTGGSLAFSPDDSSLLYETQQHDHFAVRLSDGVVSRER